LFLNKKTRREKIFFKFISYQCKIRTKCRLPARTFRTKISHKMKLRFEACVTFYHKLKMRMFVKVFGLNINTTQQLSVLIKKTTYFFY